MSPASTPLAGARALVTGGLGFIGSNLAIELAGQGAEVTIVDALLPGYGGNLFNIEPVRGRVRVNVCDIRDVNAMNTLVAGQDFVSDITKIGRLLGWRPKTPLSEGLTRTLAYYREHKSRYWP